MSLRLIACLFPDSPILRFSDSIAHSPVRSFALPLYPLAESCEEMLPDAQRIRHDRQSGIHRTTGGEETAVYNVEIIEIMGFAIDVEHGGVRIAAKTQSSILMRHAGEGDASRNIRLQRNDVLLEFNALQQRFQFAEQTNVRLFIVRRVRESNLTV